MRLYLAVFTLFAAVHCEELFNGWVQILFLYWLITICQPCFLFIMYTCLIFFLNRDQVLRIHAESEDHVRALKELEEDVESGVWPFCICWHISVFTWTPTIFIAYDPAGFLDSWLLNWTPCWHPCASLQSVCCQGLPQEKQHPFHCHDQQCASV